MRFAGKCRQTSANRASFLADGLRAWLRFEQVTISAWKANECNARVRFVWFEIPLKDRTFQWQQPVVAL
jgi:hypothetical protein